MSTLRVTAPEDPSLDARNLIAVSRTSGSVVERDKTADIIMQRLSDTKRIDHTDLMEMMEALTDAPMGSTVFRESLADRIRMQVLIEGIDELSTIGYMCSLLKRMHPRISFPCNLDGGTMEQITNLSGLACRIDEYFNSTSIGQTGKVQFAIESLKSIDGAKNDSLRQLLLDQLIGFLKRAQCDDLVTLARVTKYLSPKYNKSLIRLVRNALESENLHQGDLVVARMLLTIESEELRDILLGRFVPRWIEDSSGSEVEVFVSTCSIPLPLEILSVVWEKLSGDGQMSLGTFVALGPVLVGKSVLPSSVVNTDISMKELSAMAKIVSRQSLESARIVSPRILKVVPSDLDVTKRAYMREYIYNMAEICKRIDLGVTGICDPFLGPEMVLKTLMISSNVSLKEYANCLQLAISIELMDVCEELVKSVLHRRTTYPEETVPKSLMLALETIRIEFSGWYLSQFPESQRATIQALVRSNI